MCAAGGVQRACVRRARTLPAGSCRRRWCAQSLSAAITRGCGADLASTTLCRSLLTQASPLPPPLGLGWAVGLGTVGDSLFGTGWGSSGFRLTQSRAAVQRPRGRLCPWPCFALLACASDAVSSWLGSVLPLTGPSGEVVFFLALSCPSCSRFCCSLLGGGACRNPCRVGVGEMLAASLGLGMSGALCSASYVKDVLSHPMRGGVAAALNHAGQVAGGPLAL